MIIFQGKRNTMKDQIQSCSYTESTPTLQVGGDYKENPVQY